MVISIEVKQKRLAEVNCVVPACPWLSTQSPNILNEQSSHNCLEGIFCNILLVSRIMLEFYLLFLFISIFTLSENKYVLLFK